MQLSLLAYSIEEKNEGEMKEKVQSRPPVSLLFFSFPSSVFYAIIKGTIEK